MKGLVLAALLVPSAFAASFTLAQVLSAPIPSELAAAPGGARIAWLLNERGARNINVAAAPEFKGVKLTNYTEDDGQDVGRLRWTPGARALVYTRAGDREFLGRPDANPAADPKGVDQAVWIAAGPSAARLAFDSSPMASVRTWLSSVLLIQGDDDRNVNFAETINLTKALRQQGIYFEPLILPDEIHSFLRHASWLRGYHAADFFKRKL